MSTITPGSATPSLPLPMPRQHRLLRGIGRGLARLAIALIVLGGVGAIYQAIAAERDRRAYPPPGQMVDVGGHRLHLQIMGQPQGGPTVILDAGMASFSTNWHWVQTELAPTTRVVAYDRTGLGWSEADRGPRDAHQSARELHTALQNANVAGPYVVVGHSYGGLVVRAFADLFPDDVVGMVLVDASHPDQWAHIPASRGGQVTALSNKVVAALAQVGLPRVFDWVTPRVAAGLPAQQYAEMKAILAQPQSWVTSSDVLAVWDERTRPQVNEARSLGNMPLAVLSVTEQPLYGETLTRLQAELSALSSNSIHRRVEGATHEDLIAEREHALTVVDAIRQVVEAARTGRPLAP